MIRLSREVLFSYGTPPGDQNRGSFNAFNSDHR